MIMRECIFTVILSLLCLGGSLNAAQLTPSQALSRVGVKAHSQQIQSTDADSGVMPQLRLTMEHDGLNTVYVFSRGDNGGYLVVAADDVAPVALLGYADSGEFDATSIPANMQWWLGQYSAEIGFSAQSDAASADDGDIFAGKAAIEPLLKTTWGQSEPYNALCPVVNGELCPTGCVATAMAQVMKFWNWPEHGVGSCSYVLGHTGEMLSFDFAATTYKWSDMLDSYGEDASDAAKKAVAELMYSCGVSIEMSYSPSASGGNYLVASRSMVNYFNYDKGLRCLGRDYYGLEEWIDMIYTELSAGRPVLYSGSNTESGHAFVCDGYDGNGYFHINWGWKGLSNGYFQITALNPKDQGIGGSTGGFNINQSMLIGVQPPVEGSEVIPVMQFVSDFSVRSDSYDRATQAEVVFTDRRGVFNQSVGDVEVVLGVRLVDEAGKETYIGALETKNMIPGSAFVNYSIPTADFPKTGTYIVSPVVRTASGKWYDMGVKMSNIREQKLTATPTTLTFEDVDEPVVTVSGLKLASDIVPGKDCSITATISNTSADEFYEDIQPVLVQDGKEVAQGLPVAVELLGGDSRLFEWVTAFTPEPALGSYQLHLVNSSGKNVCRPINVEVTDGATSGIDNAGIDGDGVRLESNPVNDVAVILSGSPANEVMVFTTSGLLAARYEPVGDCRCELDVANLPYGIYLVRVHTADGAATVLRLVKK